MKEKETSDKEFVKKYEAHENQSTEDYIQSHSATFHELQETISYLIQHRQLLRDVELEALEAESEKLLSRLKSLESQKLFEEIQCFKDILSMQKRLIAQNDKPRD